jgi:LysM repeat protein
MDIVTINHLGPHAIIKPGDRLIVKLAEGQAPPPAPTTHVVQTGETAWTIAALHGLTLDELLNLNGINRSTVLYPGDVVLIRQPDPTPLPTDIPPDTPDTPTPEPRPTRSDVTLAPTWTPSPTPTPSPVVPTLAPTATPAPAPLTKPANDQGGGEQSNRALLISLGVAIVGTILVAGGALIASRRQKL